MLVSTLKAYLDAVGAQATITIRVGNSEIHAGLDQIAPTRHDAPIDA